MYSKSSFRDAAGASTIHLLKGCNEFRSYTGLIKNLIMKDCIENFPFPSKLNILDSLQCADSLWSACREMLNIRRPLYCQTLIFVHRQFIFYSKKRFVSTVENNLSNPQLVLHPIHDKTDNWFSEPDIFLVNLAGQIILEIFLLMHPFILC